MFSKKDKKEKILTVKNLYKVRKANSINFELYKSEILGITGMTGAGKTELAKLLFGADNKDSGEIWLGESLVNIKSPVKALQLGIYYVSEDRHKEGLLINESIRFNFSLTCIEKFCSFLGFIKQREERNFTLDFLKKFNVVYNTIDESIARLSGGNQQKVNIGKWVMRSTIYKKGKIFIFDEPTKGIDIGAKEEIYTIITNLSILGYGIIFISPEIPEILRIADRILVMASNSIVTELDKETATEEQILKYTMRGDIYK